MAYEVLTTKKFDKQLKKLDNQIKIMVSEWILKNLVDTEDPRLHGSALVGNLKGYWRYRIGAYRLIVEIHDEELTILAVEIEHRSEVYK